MNELHKDYISWIYRALESREGCRKIARFKIDLPSVRKADKYYQKVLEFALSRETEIIDLRVIYYTCDSEYLSPLPKINRSMHSLRARGLKYLKELYLIGARLIDDYGGDVLNDFISKFPVLEHLSIESPISTFKGKNYLRLNGVIGDSVSNLKYLSISKFAKISSIRVFDMLNLVSLRCHGPEPYDLYLHNLPKLLDANIDRMRIRIDSARFRVFRLRSAPNWSTFELVFVLIVDRYVRIDCRIVVVLFIILII